MKRLLGLLVLAGPIGLAGSVFHTEEGSIGGVAVDPGLQAAHARAVATARGLGAGVATSGPSPHSLGAAAANVARVAHAGGAVPGTQLSGWQRTADTSHAGALFAAHSWYVPPPPPPPVAPAPPPPPAAPPFPYTFVGSYAPIGAKPVYFLSRADRVIDAHVGDRLDGVYEFESAGSGSLVFNYLPLNIRQTVSIGVSQ
jgi:hypothetical protein